MRTPPHQGLVRTSISNNSAQVGLAPSCAPSDSPRSPMISDVEGRPDRLELVIRFVCGFVVVSCVVGRVVGSGGMLAGLVAGLLAARYGDAFWHALGGLFPWRR